MLRLTTFGGLALSSDGAPMTGAATQRSRLAVLALLASAGPAGISRDKLLLYLWPETDSEHARQRLKQAVYKLRQDLGLEEVIVGTATLSLNAALVTSDLWDFEQALERGDDAAAAVAYAGPFLDGVYFKDAPEFERWTAEERARLAHDWCSAVERLAGRSEAAGEWREAIAWRRQLATAEPLGGRVAIALMRALAESGDVGAALQHFRVHEMLVREELDAAPESDVVALADAMRSGTWERSAPVIRVTPIPAAAPLAIAESPVTTEPVAEGLPSPVVGSAPSIPVAVSDGAGGSHSWRRIAIGLAVVIVVVAITAFVYARTPPDKRPFAGAAQTEPQTAIKPGLYVVAPLDNMTQDTTLDAFGKLASETMTNALTAAKIDVVPALTASLTKEALASLPPAARPHELGLAVAKAYGASTAIVGSYYQSGDTVRVMVQFIDMATGQAGASFPTIEGVVNGKIGPIPLAKQLGQAMLARMVQAADTTPAGKTIALVPATSYPAYEDVTRAYSLFLHISADTASVFDLLSRAEALDPEYTAPLLIRAYILDVKRLWPGTEAVVQQLKPFTPRLNEVEHNLLNLYDSDLGGDPYGRLIAARSIMKLSPGATDMALLVTLSALYVGRPEEALSALKGANPALVFPVYWEWRAEAEHEAGQYPAEAASAKEGNAHFPTSSSSIRTMARVLATQGGKRLGDLNALFAAGVPEDSNPKMGRLDLMVTAARELRHHGDSAAAATIFWRVANEESGLTPTSPRFERHVKASVLYDLGQYAAARPILTELLRTDPTDLVAKGRLGAIAIHMKDAAAAARIDAELAAVKTPYLVGDAVAWRAHIAAADGRIDDAVVLLRSAVHHGYRLMDLETNTVHLDPDFVQLNKSPAYLELTRELAQATIP